MTAPASLDGAADARMEQLLDEVAALLGLPVPAPVPARGAAPMSASRIPTGVASVSVPHSGGSTISDPAGGWPAGYR